MNPISKLIYLWQRREDKDMKIALMFYTCLCLIIVVDLIFAYIFFFESKVMFVVNMICLFMNLYIYHLLELNKRVMGVYVLLGELLFFLIFATIIMGWHYGFQQYIYGMLCIFFLPFYVTEKKKNTHIHMAMVGILFVSTYYILDYICNGTSLAPGIEDAYFSSNFIYALNSFVSIAAVSAFCILSSMINSEVTKKLRRKADFDELTQIYNRYGLNQIIEDLVKEKKNFYIAIADIDHFKGVNDTYGHDAGDLVLKDLASNLIKLTKNKVYVGRWGGEEFVVIGDPSISHGEFKKILNNLRKIYEKRTIESCKYKINITISFGIGKYDSKKSFECAIKEADNNLYKAKETGRNKVVG